MRPRCYNREPFKAEYTAPNGEKVPFRMSQECGSWAVPEGQTPYPELAKWNCDGCRWNPNEGESCKN